VSHPVGFVPLSRFFLGPSLVLPGLVPGLATGCQGWLVRAETDCHGIEDNAFFVLYKRWRRFDRSAADAIQKYIGFLKSFLERLRPIAGQLELAESPTILVELGIFGAVMFNPCRGDVRLLHLLTALLPGLPSP
jgi:hypothetical protein